MTINPLSDQKIVDSWEKNSKLWIAAVRDGQIESRRLVTNSAIIDAVLSRSPSTVLDIGCGEGWLARELLAKGVNVLGTDVVPSLIKQARMAGGGRFELVSYEELAAGKLKEQFDVAVANFSLLGKESVEKLFGSISSLLTPAGAFIVQTIHPLVACGEQRYEDGWREGSWAGFSSEFTDPAPWYFRKLETWIRLYAEHNLRLVEMREPLNPLTEKPASVLFIGSRLKPS